MSMPTLVDVFPQDLVNFYEYPKWRTLDEEKKST
jgi:hypothetical protein